MLRRAFNVRISPSPIVALAISCGIVWFYCNAESPTTATASPASDWLVGPVEARAKIETISGGIRITNALVARTFLLDSKVAPNGATVALENLCTGVQILRGVKPEASITVNGKRIEIGGLKGQPDYAYLDPRWIKDLKSSPDAFQFTRYDTGDPIAPYPWQPKRHAPDAAWPPKGVRLVLHFRAPDACTDACKGLKVDVCYELYDGIPVIGKWIEIENTGPQSATIDAVETEILAVTEDEKPRLHIESDYNFNTAVTTQWVPDTDYTSQVNYELKSPILLTSSYPLGPGVVLKQGERFKTFRTFELLLDSDDRERAGLARRRMMRTLAPQITENPIFMHVRNSDSESIRRAVDQCADVGFEMVILTFGSGFNIESEDPAYIARFKADIDYAHAKGVEIGGYTLMAASRDVGPDSNIISKDTGKPGSMFGQSACLASAWSDGYFQRVLHFMDATGMSMIETDGPYHGDRCASTTHAYHSGYEDSMVHQWERCANFYHECRKRGIFINTPDLYYLTGSNKCAIGYRETNFSLPRWQQILIARQNIYDATYEKTPSMGWMFVPLVEYQGGGAAATMEPLSAHLAEYGWYLAQNFGCGVQACYRGPRLYDSDATRAVVKKWVDFYKAHRDILDSDIIHVRRADSRGLDCVMHVNPKLQERALAMVFNPADFAQTETITLPLYYTGLTKTASVQVEGGEAKAYELDRAYNAQVKVQVKEKGITWLIIEAK